MFLPRPSSPLHAVLSVGSSATGAGAGAGAGAGSGAQLSSCGRTATHLSLPSAARSGSSSDVTLSSVSASAPLVFSVSVVEPDEELSAMGAAGACAVADACRFVFGNARASFFSFRSFSAFCNAARAR